MAYWCNHPKKPARISRQKIFKGKIFGHCLKKGCHYVLRQKRRPRKPLLQRKQSRKIRVLI